MDSLARPRILAYLLDNIVLAAIVSGPLSTFLKIPEQGIFSLAVSGFYSICAVTYWTFSDYLIGQSLGKMAFSLKAVSETRSQMNIVQALARNITKGMGILLAIESIPLIFGNAKKRLTEEVSRTRVVTWGRKREN